MKKDKSKNLDGQIWKPTGRRLNGRPLFKSLAGEMAVEIDGEFFIAAKELGRCSVCNIIHGEGWNGDCYAT